MTARCVRVVQNVPFCSPRTDLEKDVSPSVLSSGGALTSTLSAYRLQGFRQVLGGASASLSLNAPVNVRPFNHHWGAFSAPTNPIDQSLEKCLSIWTEPCTNRPPFGYREQVAVQSRPTLRGLDAVSVSLLNLDHCFVNGKRPRGCPWMQRSIEWWESGCEIRSEPFFEPSRSGHIVAVVAQNFSLQICFDLRIGFGQKAVELHHRPL